MAILKFYAKFFPVVIGMYCCTLTVKIVMVEMQGTKNIIFIKMGEWLDNDSASFTIEEPWSR